MKAMSVCIASFTSSSSGDIEKADDRVSETKMFEEPLNFEQNHNRASDGFSRDIPVCLSSIDPVLHDS
jgi:hypothetical protein